MKLVAVVVAVVLSWSGCLVSPVIPIGSGKSPRQAQRDHLGSLLPAQMTAPRAWKGEVRVAKLRVWADDEYRAQNMRWQHGFDEQLDDANELLVPMLGIRLEADYRAWDHHAPGSTLTEHLDALVRDDSADDVVWIVGLTSSLSLVSATFDQLGVAYEMDRHVMLRGHADIEERKAFRRAFPDIDTQQREGVLEARRRHKTTAILLHELAHSLGALHETEKHWIMNPSYSHNAAAISERNRQLMAITLEDRLKPAAQRNPRTTAQQLLTVLEDPWPGWAADERVQLSARLRQQLGTAPAAIAGAVPAAVDSQYKLAEQQLTARKYAEALSTLDALLVTYPAHVQLRVLGCKIELARAGAKDAKAIATCDRAARLSPEVGPAVEVAAARLSAGDVAGARATLRAAEARIADLPPDKAPTAWLTLARQYQELNAITWAEAALANAGLGAGIDPGIATWAAMTRMRYGIPRDGERWKLSADNEADALAAVKDAHALANNNRFDAARQAATAAERRWPGLPGLLAVRCDIELNSGNQAGARTFCNRALSHGESSWAVYLLGVLDLRRDGSIAHPAGIKRLREAIQLDPELGPAWRSLAKALARSKATADYEQLRRDYEARFHSPLP
jgi:predicted Zn-dependent protease